ncbi:MAG: cryptochrome/photolyase family protein [Mariniblastus sp.]
MNLLIFPNQLFANHPGLKLRPSRVILIEDSLFFGDEHYPMKFHKQKLWLHRATMKRYEAFLKEKDFRTMYFDFEPESPNALESQLAEIIRGLKSSPRKLITINPTDFLLEKRLKRFCNRLETEIDFLPNPGFLNQPHENQEYRTGKKRWFMADFYKRQRKELDILMDGEKPVGGKWSFDDDNRKKVPKKLLDSVPTNLQLKRDSFDESAVKHVAKHFPENLGSLEETFYPTSHSDAKKWLKHFLQKRFELFGVYEDAIVEGESWLWHSMLTPALNIGLITPQEVIKEAIKFADKNDIPLNSLEGFIRQVIGWREFMRATYEDLGVTMRTTNHWGHHRKIPASFYDGTTGIAPLDDTISRVLKTGYCHHIERLMVLGGFMFLCEFDPKEIYKWFMELFIDSYDWVMVPNVYAMSQHADGGLITTKPYFSGSSYIRKMSHHKKGEWCEVWDGLYWRWIWNHHEELGKNPRWAMMCSMAKKMDASKRELHLKNAEGFLDTL